MTHILTLISNPAAPALDEALLARARAQLPEAGQPEWLAPDVAADIPFTLEGADPRALRTRIVAVLDNAPVDRVMQSVAGRRKALLVADMDSTMIEQEGIDELAALAGVRAEIAAVTERAMRGELAFEPALRSRIALLKGLSRQQVETVIAERITLTPGARTLVQTMRAHGARCALVSGGFTLFSEDIVRRVGFDEHHANTLLFDKNDTLSGETAEPIFGRTSKLDTLRAVCRRMEITPAEAIAVGDGANDLDMIGAAGLGVAFRAKPVVAEAAGARIDHGDLTALLFIQGYRRDSFAN